MTTPHPQSPAKAVLSTIIRHPNWPIPGVDFADLSPVYASPHLFKLVVEDLAARCQALNPSSPPTHIAGLDARGFILGTGLAMALNLPFIMIRKKGKSPGLCHSTDYALEYGHATIELQHAALPPRSRVILADDLLATGGTLKAAKSLVELAGASCICAAVILEIPGLAARTTLGMEVLSTASI